MLKFLPVDWSSELLSKGAIQKNHDALINRCFSFGGYISGGFARVVASKILSKHLWGNDSKEWNGWEIERYYRLHGRISPPWENKAPPQTKELRNSWKSGRGDIDIFFPDEEKALRAVENTTRGPFKVELDAPSPAGFAREFIVDGCCFQLITKVNGTPEDVLSSFDIANAKVALVPGGILLTKEWIDLERFNRIGIDKWDKPNLLWRVHKWVKRHSYSDLRQGDHDKYLDFLFKTFEEAKSGNFIMYNRPVLPEEVKRFVRDFIHYYPPKEALKASLLLDDYDKLQVFKRISSYDQR